MNYFMLNLSKFNHLFFFIFFLYLSNTFNVFASHTGDWRSQLHEIKILGSTGFINSCNDEKTYKISLILPKDSAPIISDWHSTYNDILCNKRGGKQYGFIDGKFKINSTGKHNGVDFYLKPDQPIIAVADGEILHAERDDCKGRSIIVLHTQKYRLHQTVIYAHVGEIKVKPGEYVKRGQVLALSEKPSDMRAETGRCGYAYPHLHFMMIDGLFPHNNWTRPGKPECFQQGQEYPNDLFTLPFTCKADPSEDDEILKIDRLKAEFSTLLGSKYCYDGNKCESRNDITICRSALNKDIDDWTKNRKQYSFIKEAFKRGFNVNSCKKILTSQNNYIENLKEVTLGLGEIGTDQRCFDLFEKENIFKEKFLPNVSHNNYYVTYIGCNVHYDNWGWWDSTGVTIEESRNKAFYGCVDDQIPKYNLTGCYLYSINDVVVWGKEESYINTLKPYSKSN